MKCFATIEMIGINEPTYRQWVFENAEIAFDPECLFILPDESNVKHRTTKNPRFEFLFQNLEESHFGTRNVSCLHDDKRRKKESGEIKFKFKFSDRICDECAKKLGFWKGHLVQVFLNPSKSQQLREYLEGLRDITPESDHCRRCSNCVKLDKPERDVVKQSASPIPPVIQSLPITPGFSAISQAQKEDPDRSIRFLHILKLLPPPVMTSSNVTNEVVQDEKQKWRDNIRSLKSYLEKSPTDSMTLPISVKPPQVNPSLQNTMTPNSVFRVFSKQSDAFCFMDNWKTPTASNTSASQLKCGKDLLDDKSSEETPQSESPLTSPHNETHQEIDSGDPLHAFSFDVNTDGRRRFFVTTYKEFWARYSNANPHDRHQYELIRETAPCHLYFDLEYLKEFNKNIQENVLVGSLKYNICHELQCLYNSVNMTVTESDIVDLDSSTPEKFSRHFIVHCPGFAWKNNSHCGGFARYLVGKHFFDASSPKFAVLKETGELTSVIDLSVYSRNRNFRMYLSSKLNKGFYLLPATTNTFDFGSFSRETNNSDLTMIPSHIMNGCTEQFSHPTVNPTTKQSHDPPSIPSLDAKKTNKLGVLLDAHTSSSIPTSSGILHTSPTFTPDLETQNISHLVCSQDNPSDQNTVTELLKGWEDVLTADLVESEKQDLYQEDDLLWLWEEMDLWDSFLHESLPAPDEENSRPDTSPSASQTPYNSSLEQISVFYSSLLCNVDWSSTHLTFWDEYNSQKNNSSKPVPTTRSLSQKKREVYSQSDDTETGFGAPSPFPLVDTFLHSSVINRGGVQGQIRSWVYHQNTRMLVYLIEGNRWCERVGRQHRSNHVMYCFDFSLCAYYQKCLDPDCSGWRAPRNPIPAEILPQFKV